MRPGQDMPVEEVRFHEFIKQTNGSPGATQLRGFVEARRSARNGGGLACAFGVIVFAAALLVLNLYDLGGWEPALFIPAFLYFGGSLLAGAHALNEEEERKKAARALELLQAEERGGRLNRVPEGEPLILFLRSFDVESLGETQDEYTLPYNYMGRLMGIPQPTRHPGDGVFMPFNSDWVHQMEALKAAREVLPVFMLDNLTLTERKQRELEAARIGVVSVITADWWEVFLNLAGRAAAIVFYVEVQTGMLSREMRYMAESGKPYVALCSEAVRTALKEELPAFLEYAAAVLPTSGRVFEQGSLKGSGDLKPVLEGILGRDTAPPAANP